MRRVLTAIACFMALAGCSVAPAYEKPRLTIPEALHLSYSEAAQKINLTWWKQFGDPQMDRLIEEALRQNLDLALASARIEELSAFYGAARADRWPFLDAATGWSRSSVAGLAVDQYQFALNGSWELDFWGRIKNSSEAARADLLAGVAARANLVLSLVANVAGAYLDLCGLDRQLQIARNTVRVRKEALALFELRLSAGLVSAMEVSQMRYEYQVALATLPQIELAIAEREHVLNVLLGRDAGPIERGLSLNDLKVPPVPGGMSARVLQQRPDIRQAEENLVAANASVGVARAAWFPSLNLTGTWGGVSPELSNLLKHSAEVWGLNAFASLPIFNAGKIRAGVAAAEARKQQALLSYRQAAQNAFREVADGLARQQKSEERLAILGEQLSTLQNYVELARELYEEGYVSNIENLDAQRNLFDSQLGYVFEKTNQLQTLVELYRIMGGGWAAADIH